MDDVKVFLESLLGWCLEGAQQSGTQALKMSAALPVPSSGTLHPPSFSEVTPFALLAKSLFSHLSPSPPEPVMGSISLPSAGGAAVTPLAALCWLS